MDEPQPASLRPATRPGGTAGWVRAHAAGLSTLVVGALACVLVAATQLDELWSTPEPWLTLPLLLVAAAGATASFVRREGAPWLPLLGLGLAAAATVLGYVVVFGAVVLVTTVVIVILHGVM